ncbi:MAG: SDR family oxidoreductase [Armatimonadetes bacterium]|nr:SDR family oxidoreductase [Armatimonadota bacterium]
MQLENKIALVTGASRGIGAAIARRLAREGAFVHVHFSRSLNEAESVLAEICAAGGDGALIQFDVSHLENTRTALENIENLDILVNNAGFAAFGPLESVSVEDFDGLFDLNTRGLFFVTQNVLLKLRENGRIVNISSGITRVNAAGGSVYAASKAAVEAFTRSWAAELGPRGITVNTVSPGMTETDLLRQVTSPEYLEKMKSETPLGRLGQSADIADVVAFLCGDEARWITANNLLAKGGVG